MDESELLELSDAIEACASAEAVRARLAPVPRRLYEEADDATPEVDDETWAAWRLGDLDEALWLAVRTDQADIVRVLTPDYADPRSRHEDGTPRETHGHPLRASMPSAAWKVSQPKVFWTVSK